MPGYFSRIHPVEREVGGRATLTSVYVAAGVVPHVATNRWTYTVPTATAAHIEAVVAVLLQDGAAAAAAQSFVTIFTTGGAYFILLYDYAFALGAIRDAREMNCGYMAAGEVLTGQTFDGKAAGTHTLVLTARYREFAV